MHKPKKLVLKNLLSHTDTTFEFRQGKAVLVIGKNLDKEEGQERNGSGKSGLNEAISIAVTGSSIRDVLTRELITRGQKECEIIFILENKRTGKDLTIYRKLYASTTKSAECSIWYGDMIEENKEKGCSDINSYNKKILDVLGISKEDFFNFFLVTKEKYVPFLSTGDTKKKEIVNRFSGADSVDKTKTYVDSDSTEKQLEIDKIEKDSNTLDGKITLLKEQLEKEEEVGSEETIAEAKDEIEDNISRLKSTITQAKFEKKNTYKDLRAAVEERKTLIKPPHIEKHVRWAEKWISKWNKIEEVLRVQSKDTSKFQAEIDIILEAEAETLEEETALKEIKTLYNESLTKLEKEFTETNNMIQGAITCPKCSHEFSLRYKDFNIETAKERIKQIEKEVKSINIDIKENEEELATYKEIFEELDKQKQEVNDRVVKYRKQFNPKFEKIQSKVTYLADYLLELGKQANSFKISVNSFKDRVSNFFEFYKRSQNIIKTRSVNLIELEESLKDLGKTDVDKIQQLKDQIEKEEETKTTLSDKLQVLVSEKLAIDQWITNFKSFKSFLANQSIKNIADYTNLFLSAIRSNITIQIEGYKELSNKTIKEQIVTSVLRDGFSVGSYGAFSAGERGRIEISNILALRELVNLNSPTGGLDLLVCDEILDSVDSMGLEYIVESLQPLEQTIMIVSQQEINSLATSTITIQKQNAVSTIIE